MQTEWVEAIKELERLNGLLGGVECHRFRLALEERGKAVERIRKLAEGAALPDSELLARLTAALAGGMEIRKRLALERGRIRVQWEEANRTGILLRRLQGADRRPSRIDYEG